ncbi:hypothetical protein TNCV_2705691 [Trichonephila clavipes]|nr:hypothetical protein TNCV_2705691 [Trichonephila clavipes]
MIVITAEIESGFVTKDDMVPFRCSRVAPRHRPLLKVLPVPGWRPMKQLAARVHFLRCGGLLDDWCVECVPEPGLRANDISRIHWSQHFFTTQSEWPIIDELLSYLTIQFPSCG